MQVWIVRRKQVWLAVHSTLALSVCTMLDVAIFSSDPCIILHLSAHPEDAIKKEDAILLSFLINEHQTSSILPQIPLFCNIPLPYFISKSTNRHT